nr:reverse transcriptase domain-containing protein [Tanacetum cinerariifolium]
MEEPADMCKTEILVSQKMARGKDKIYIDQTCSESFCRFGGSSRSFTSTIRNPSSNPTPATNLNPKGRNHRCSKQRIEDFNLEELSPPIVAMADQRTMAQLLQAPTEGYKDAIQSLLIHGLLTLVQNKQFFGHDKEDPHAHVRYFNKITSTLNPNLAGKEPPRSIFTWDDLVSKFINQFFPPSKTTNLRNEITNFQQCFNDSFSEAWDRFKDFLQACPHHVSMNTSTFGISPDVAELKDMVKALLLDKKSQNQSPAPVKAVEESCVTYGGTLPSNIIINLRSDLKSITTQSVVSYDGPQILPSTSFLPKVVEDEPESESPILNSEPVTSLISEPVITLIFKDMSFEISFADALILMPKFASILKALIGNKEKLSEMARTPLNEHYFAVLLKKLPEKLGDPGKFLIPCDFSGMAECLALVDLGTSVNLMPFSMWKRLSLPDLIPTCMTLELVDHLISRPIRVAEDVYVKEVLGFSNIISSGNPIPYYDPIISTTSLTLTPFENSDFLLEEVDAFLAIEDDPTSLEFYQPYLDLEGDILLLEAFLNDDPSLPPPNQGNYLLEVHKELKICEAKSEKSSVDEPSEVELKDLPPHLEYAFLEGDDTLPVIIAKYLSVEEKTALITGLKSHKRAIAWKLFDIKGIDPEFCTHKILMEEDFEPAVQHQRRVNPKIQDVIKQEVIKLLKAGLIYLISDSHWVSLVHCVPKKGRFTVVENEDNELIPTRLVTGWHVCIDYRKLNEATRKDHFPLPFMD